MASRLALLSAAGGYPLDWKSLSILSRLRSVGSPGDDIRRALRNWDLAVALFTDMGWAEWK